MFNRNKLSTARALKRDEFYTLYKDVKFELDHYLDQFRDKVIYCPCDNSNSAFVKYFLELESKGLIKELLYTSLPTDCLSAGAIDGYRHSDIIVTNPPFSLFRQFLSLLDSLNKKFIIWGNNNGVTYKVTTSMLVNNKIRLGYIANKTCEFEVPDDYADVPNSKVYKRDNRNYVKVASITVFTNLDVYRDLKLDLCSTYNSNTYPKYDNFDAINCNKTSDIPIDYYGYIGVPVTYLAKHDPSMFKIIGVFNNFKECDFSSGQLCGELVHFDKPPYSTKGPTINGNPIYARLVIQRKQ